MDLQTDPRHVNEIMRDMFPMSAKERQERTQAARDKAIEEINKMLEETEH